MLSLRTPLLFAMWLQVLLICFAVVPPATASCNSNHNTDVLMSSTPNTFQELKSDADGSDKESRSTPGESCFWHVRCPVGRVQISNGKLGLHANQLLAYEGPTGAAATWYDPATMPTLAHFTGYAKMSGMSYNFNSSSVFFQYNVTEDAEGFSITVTCDQTTCTGGSTAEIGSTGVFTYTTDVDGAGTNLFDSGTCLEDLTCPSNKPTLRISMTYSLISSTVDFTSGTLGSGSVAPIRLKEYLFDATGVFYSLKMNAPARMRFLKTRSVDSKNYGVTANYECLDEKLCRSSTADGTSVTLAQCSYGAQDNRVGVLCDRHGFLCLMADWHFCDVL